jgi:cell wall assembly regulator SMI1
MSFTTELHFIESAEEKLGVKLPSSFREHLLKYNGGEINVMDMPWELNPVLDVSDKEHARRTGIDIVKETASAREWRGFPQRAVSIGSDGCGNHLVFLPIESDAAILKPTVFIWWHEGSELEVVANDFGEL